MSNPNPQDIVGYWLGDSAQSAEKAESRHALWYSGGNAVDEEIRHRFLSCVLQARQGALGIWENSPEGALALVILLDQFTRNLFRGTPEAYSGDQLAQAVANRAISAGFEQKLSVPGRIFLYHPFHHSETASEQNQGVALLEVLEKEVTHQWRTYVRRSIEGFGGHRDVVVRFGRFPHRNRTLGRDSTVEELAYLESKPDTYGQTKP